MKQLTPEDTASLEAQNGKKLWIQPPDGPIDSYLFIAPSTALSTQLTIIFYCDAGGVRPGMFKMARQLANLGYSVLMPNLYHRQGDYKSFDTATVFSNPDEQARLMAMMASLTVNEAMRDTQACLDYLQKEFPISQMGVIGYCMGGRLALNAAGHFSELTAAASIHGGSLATDDPGSPHHKAEQIKSKLYLGIASIDPFFSETEQARLCQSLDQAKVDYLLKVYPETQHGFAVVDMPVYEPVSTAQHWLDLQAFFNRAVQTTYSSSFIQQIEA